MTAVHHSQCNAAAAGQQRRRLAVADLARMTFASVTSPFSPKCSLSLCSSMYAGRFLTHSLDVVGCSVMLVKSCGGASSDNLLMPSRHYTSIGM
jgi:hypothetical protein